MRTELCEMLGIDLPIIQAPIGSAAGAPIAAAVSNSGGLGTVAVSGFGADVAREKIRAVRERTSKPFAINLLMSFPHEEELEVCLEERVPAVSFFWGDPSRHVERFHAAGTTVLLQVGSVEEARADPCPGRTQCQDSRQSSTVDNATSGDNRDWRHGIDYARHQG